MIDGWEEQTKPLNEAEMKALPILIKVFRNRIGKSRLIGGETIVTELKDKCGIDLGKPINNPRLRKIINRIRANKMLRTVDGRLLYLVSNNQGYWAELDRNSPEVVRFVRSTNQRADNVLSILAGFQEDDDFRVGQQVLGFLKNPRPEKMTGEKK